MSLSAEPQPSAAAPIVFPEDWLFIDLEVTGERVTSIGLVRGDRHLRVDGTGRSAMMQVRDFATGARLIIGHNAWDHDRRIIDALSELAPLHALPMLDTLPLSVIAFPQRPYHALVKDYRLVRSSLSDPVEDCRLCQQLLVDVSNALRNPNVYQRFALAVLQQESTPDPDAMSLYSTFLGHDARPLVDCAQEAYRAAHGITCAPQLTALMNAVTRGERDPVPAAYAMVWLSAAGSYSSLPPWVANRYPEANEIINSLRDTSCGQSSCAWCQSTNDEKAALKFWFDFDDFRAIPAAPGGGSLQQAIVRNGLARRSTFAVLPTGGGKSICFQLPALVRAERTGALTVVISPLQSLMKDQVENLMEHAADAVGQVNGGLTLPERARELEGIRDGRLAIVYLSPEQLRNKSVCKALASRAIAAWVFDEAHCLAKWGHDFRTDYLYAPKFIAELARKQNTPPPPVFCFTATAQRQVIAEATEAIANETGHELVPLLGGISRDNLTYEVRAVNEHQKLPTVKALVEAALQEYETGSVVIFAATRKKTEETRDFLLANDIEASAYHAGLDGSVRRDVQSEFLRSTQAVIVATSAFGMGVDKPDVRLVIHLSIPGSIESYLQQAGRAGRDRTHAHCLLLWGEDDAETQFRLARRSRLQHADIQAIHRSVRHAPAVSIDETASETAHTKTVVSHAELIRTGSARARFSPDDAGDVTRVNTAVAWLERAGLLARGENINRVFQGSARVGTRAEVQQRFEDAGIGEGKQRELLRVLTVFELAEADEMLSADDIATRACLWNRSEGEGKTLGGQRVLALLKDLAQLNVLAEHTRFTAFVRHGVADSSTLRLDRLEAMDVALRDVMETLHTSAGQADTLVADLEALTRHLLQVAPDIAAPALARPQVQALWRSYVVDGAGFAEPANSLRYRFAGGARFRVDLLHSWPEIGERRKRFFDVCRLILRYLVSRLDKGARGATLLLDFETDTLSHELKADLALGPHLRDTHDTIRSALLLLHDARVITLQNGLAVFRQALTIRVPKRARQLQFKKSDFQPLLDHYQRRNTQIHVMAEYARLGQTDMAAAQRLTLDWFSLPEKSFLTAWMPGREEELQRVTTQHSYDAIVTSLDHPIQEGIVCASPDENLLVLAGPGSGKTRVIVHRVAYLVRIAGLDPAGIFALAYNRAAAHEIRKRLRALIGQEARFVRVHTLHGLAAALVGRLPLTAPGNYDQVDDTFASLIRDATALLNASDDAASGPREELLGGCSHLLIDEYQDIDASQAELVSAMAGRLVSDGRKLSVLAVGDDDQNIYGFRGADTRFIQEFAASYDAEQRTLVENFRSTHAIVDAANHLIAKAPHRLKVKNPIRVNGERQTDPYGGQWENIDHVLSRGRVRIVYCDGPLGAGDFVADDALRLAGLRPSGSLDDFAVLGRTRSELHPVREAFRMRNKQCKWTLGSQNALPMYAVREFASLRLWLRDRAGTELRVSDLIDAHAWLSEPGHNPWARAVLLELDAWDVEHGDAPVTAGALELAMRDAVADARTTQTIGQGVTVTTIHSAKGLEFPHVYVLPGDLREGLSPADREAERRLLYVGLTRAEQTVTVVVSRDVSNPFITRLESKPEVEKVRWTTRQPAQRVSFDIIGLGDLWIDWAGQQRTGDTHERLSALSHGNRLTVRTGDRRNWLGLYSGDVQVAAMNKLARQKWSPKAPLIAEAQVLAMVRREAAQTDDDTYRRRLVQASWEVPVAEVRLRE